MTDSQILVDFLTNAVYLSLFVILSLKTVGVSFVPKETHQDLPQHPQNAVSSEINHSTSLPGESNGKSVFCFKWQIAREFVVLNVL